MEPSSQEIGPAPLPPSMPEELRPAVNPAEKAGLSGGEQLPAVPEMAPLAPATQSVPAKPAIPMPFPPAAPANPPADNVPGTTASVSVPALDDQDLIEKEWVNKAKQIVERNRDDPYKQSEELTVFRAEYMKKRYGKTIKLNK